ncbi:PhzF family phenazine biosynthesis protein [Streptomyces stelliscabiei]|uniref:PhzF family phenazine biosynthesis protein n=1 Tax=Streptomyces stelliscabiei TaxID=146820 RepID=UPI002FF0FBB4
MLAIAAEVGYSETAFVTAADESARRFRVRYFSPLAEVAFCGHATVAWPWRSPSGWVPARSSWTTPAGEIPVATTLDDVDGTVRATLTSVPARSRPATAAERDAASTPSAGPPTTSDPALPPHVAFAAS